MRLATGAAALLVLIAGSRVGNAGLIVDGSFENASPPAGGYTQSIPGWTLTHADQYTGVVSTYLAGITAHSGNNWATISNMQGNGLAILSQTLTTTIPGASYDLSFYFAAGRYSGIGTEFKVVWDGTTLMDLINYASTGWTRYDFVVQATGNDLVQFEGFNDPSWNGLDDVSLEPKLAAAATQTPEPATVLLFGLLVPAGLFWSARVRPSPVAA